VPTALGGMWSAEMLQAVETGKVWKVMLGRQAASCTRHAEYAAQAPQATETMPCPEPNRGSGGTGIGPGHPPQGARRGRRSLELRKDPNDPVQGWTAEERSCWRH